MFNCVKDNFNNINLRADFHSYNTKNRNQTNLSQQNLSFCTNFKFLNQLPPKLKSQTQKNCFRKIVSKRS